MSSCLTKTAFWGFTVCCTCTVLFGGWHVHCKYSHSSHLILSQFTPDIAESALLWECWPFISLSNHLATGYNNPKVSAWVEGFKCHMNTWYPSSQALSLIPRPPFNPPRGKGGLVNTVQNFCTLVEFRWHNLIGWLSHLYWASLPQSRGGRISSTVHVK